MPDAKTQKTDVPGVYKRGDKYLYVYRKRGRQVWGTAPTKAEARRLKRNAETDVERGDHRDAARETFGEYARQWVTHYNGRTSKGIRDSTREWYARCWRTGSSPTSTPSEGCGSLRSSPGTSRA